LFIDSICEWFGLPRAIAARVKLPRKEYKILLAWIADAEALLRRILVIEAASLDLKPAAAKIQPRATKPQKKTDKEHLHQTRSSFKLAEPEPAETKPVTDTSFFDNRGYRERKRFFNVQGLARRFEALLRVFDAPQQYINRAARLVQRDPKQLKRL